jgi:aminopeptidase N
MTSGTTLRRLLSFTLTFLLIVSSTAGVNFAQRRRVKKQPPASAQKSVPRRLPAGTKHARPQRTYDVLHYVIATRFDVPGKTVVGDERVSLKPLAPGFKSFELDASNMKIEAVTLPDTGAALQWTQPPDKLAITLDRAYDPSETVTVRILYRATPARGLYFIQQGQGGGTGWTKPAQIWTQGEPEDNHHWFPCYDFPDDKATSEQYITTGPNEIAISNGTLLETTTNADGTRTFHWKMEQPHASYLTSLVVGDYAKLDDAYKNIPLEYYTYRGTEETARRAFLKTPEMMRLFGQKLDYEYPYVRYAQTIVASFIFGGMENITATTHADSEILYSVNSKEAQLASENLISHELAHSWFGNLVTCKDWSELWLNEGFATFMEAVFREHEAGRDAYLEEMRSNSSLYFIEDLLRYRRPLVYNLYGSALDIFDATVYKKGAWVVHMLRETVGDEMFWKALHRYLEEYKYKPVGTSDLLRVFEETTGQQLDWFFDQWVYKAGFPELRVRSSFQAQTGHLTLEVTQTQSAEAMTPLVFRLPVEIELATHKGERTERIEITQRSQRFTFKLDGKPLMIRFDKGARILKKVDFQQPASMLKYQLAHSSDAAGRTEAAEALAQLARRELRALEVKLGASQRREFAGMDRRRGQTGRARPASHGIFP